ncbi:hypothetical protein V6N13_069921 [Hibiscus sabdariffa]
MQHSGGEDDKPHEEVQELTSNALHLVSGITSIVKDLNIPVIGNLGATRLLRKLLLSNDRFPEWMIFGDRRLLHAIDVTPNVVVAKDGSGKYDSINKALAEVPKKTPTRFVIYVKADVYKENVNITKSMSNVMMIGDGLTKTIGRKKLVPKLSDRGLPPVKDKNKAYLARPWKAYATTIIMQSQIDDIIAPEGYTPMNGTVDHDTSFYAEINNRGLDVRIDGRIKWRDIKHLYLNAVKEYTHRTFLKSESWIPQTGIPCTPDLLQGV